GYITWQLFTAFGLDPFLTLPVDAVALFVLGYALQRGVINRIIRAPLLFTFLLTFGLNLVIVNILLLIFGSDFRSVTPTYSGQGFEIGGIVVPYVRLTSLGAAILLSAGLAFLLSRTRIGLAIHAIAADRDAAQLVGIDLRHAYAVTYGLGAACAGVAGGLIAMIQAIIATADSQRRWRRLFLIVGAIVAAYALLAPLTSLDAAQSANVPLLADKFWFRIATYVVMFVVMATAWNIIGGITGYAAFGNVAF